MNSTQSNTKWANTLTRTSRNESKFLLSNLNYLKSKIDSLLEENKLAEILTVFEETINNFLIKIDDLEINKVYLAFENMRITNLIYMKNQENLKLIERIKTFENDLNNSNNLLASKLKELANENKILTKKYNDIKRRFNDEKSKIIIELEELEKINDEYDYKYNNLIKDYTTLKDENIKLTKSNEEYKNNLTSIEERFNNHLKKLKNKHKKDLEDVINQVNSKNDVEKKVLKKDLEDRFKKEKEILNNEKRNLLEQLNLIEEEFNEFKEKYIDLTKENKFLFEDNEKLEKACEILNDELQKIKDNEFDAFKKKEIANHINNLKKELQKNKEEFQFDLELQMNEKIENIKKENEEKILQLNKENAKLNSINKDLEREIDILKTALIDSDRNLNNLKSEYEKLRNICIEHFEVLKYNLNLD